MRTWKTISELKRMKPGATLYKGSASGSTQEVIFVGLMEGDGYNEDWTVVAYRYPWEKLVRRAHHSNFLRSNPRGHAPWLE